MPLYLNHNGSVTAASAPLVGAGNRGLRYGDGLFETMRLVNNTIPFFAAHAQRLFEGMAQLGFTIPGYFTEEYLQEKILELCRLNEVSATARIRLMVFRGNGTLYDVQDHLPHYIIETFPIQADKASDGSGLITGIYEDARKAIDKFSHIKSNNYQPYMLAALHARKMGWHDSILLNTSGNVCESSIANIFIIKDGTIITPSLAQGCIAGIMRKHLLKDLPALGYQLKEDTLTRNMLLEADEVFITNSVQGIRQVAQTGDTRYSNNIITQIKHAVGY